MPQKVGVEEQDHKRWSPGRILDIPDGEQGHIPVHLVCLVTLPIS